MLTDNIKELPIWAWAAAAAFLLLARAVSFRYQKGLSKYDGPLLASFTDFWRLWQSYKHTDYVFYADLLKYGDVVRLGPNLLLFSDPAAIKDVFSSGFPKVS